MDGDGVEVGEEALPFVEDREVGPREELEALVVVDTLGRAEGEEPLAADAEGQALAEPGRGGLRVGRLGLAVEEALDDVFAQGDEQTFGGRGVVEVERGRVGVGADRLAGGDADVGAVAVLEGRPGDEVGGSALLVGPQGAEEEGKLGGVGDGDVDGQGEAGPLLREEVAGVLGLRKLVPEGAVVEVERRSRGRSRRGRRRRAR